MTRRAVVGGVTGHGLGDKVDGESTRAVTLTAVAGECHRFGERLTAEGMGTPDAVVGLAALLAVGVDASVGTAMHSHVGLCNVSTRGGHERQREEE